MGLPRLSTILANIFLYTEFMYKPVVSSVLWSPPEVAMPWCCPCSHLDRQAHGGGILCLPEPCCGCRDYNPTFPGRPKSFSMPPVSSPESWPTSWGVEFAVTRFPFIGWPLTLVAAAGILVYGTFVSTGLEVRWILCLMISWRPCSLRVNRGPH